MKLLRGQNALVTGAASGIGRAVALALAGEGVTLALTDRDADGLAATARATREAGVAVTTAACDLADPEAIRAMLRKLVGDGALAILVNCAGLAWYGQQHAMTDAEWRGLLAVNLLAPIQITTETLPNLLRADAAHVVNIASMLGVFPGRRLSAYTASKFGLVGFTLAMRADYHRRDRFGLSAICPGFVRTPMLQLRGSPVAPGKLPSIPEFASTTPEHVAEVTLDAIRRDRGLVLVTAFAKIGWALMRLSPGLFDWLNREGWRQRGRIDPPAPPQR
jgi:3-oxoacyl-[acyl-carrier protein] reductase